MKKRFLSLLLCAVMLTGVMPGIGFSAEAADKPAKTVLFDYTCDSITDPLVSVTSNNRPFYYFADSKTEGVAEGTVETGSNGKAEGYTTMTIPFTAKEKSFSLQVDMKIESLMSPSGSHIWRGLVFEIDLPGFRQIYLNLHTMTEPDENGKNATVMAMKASRGPDGAMSEKITVPTDGKFHKWDIQFDGESEVRLYIDGTLQAVFPEITLGCTAAEAALKIKNVMHNIGSGTTVAVFDNIKMVSGIEMLKTDIESVSIPTDAAADNFTVTTVTSNVTDATEIIITIASLDDKTKVYTHKYRPTDTTSTVTLTDIPFSGMCRISVEAVGAAMPYVLERPLYTSYNTLTANDIITASEPMHAYKFTNLHLLELPEDTKWTPSYYKFADGAYGSALYCPGLKVEHSFRIPVKLNGKFAVYVGCLQGSKSITVNGKEAFLSNSNTSGNKILEYFTVAGDFKSESITITNTQGQFARIAYIKFVSITDEIYENYLLEDDSHNLMMDNDGYSMFTANGRNTPEALTQAVIGAYQDTIGLRKYNFAVWVTSMLNFPSKTHKEYVEKRLTELNIPEDKWPKDFMDHVDNNGKHLDFSNLMRQADMRAMNNIKTLNKHGIPHEILANYAKENVSGDVYVSLRMSAYYGDQYAFMNSSLYYLHPEWVRGGAYQLSYKHEEYRNYVHDLLMEMASSENVSGITMDFGRYYYIFGSELTDVKERTRIMNEFVKSVHDDLPEGKILNARVLNPTAEKAEAWGLDYKTWVKEGWVDRLIISDQGHETFFDITPYAEFFKDYPDVEFYLGINATLSGHDTTKEEEAILLAGGEIPGKELVTFEQFMLRAYEAYMAGADGIFIFNGLTGGANPEYGHMNNKNRMIKWYTFTYPTANLSETVEFVNKKDVPEEFKTGITAVPETTAADSTADTDTADTPAKAGGNNLPLYAGIGAAVVIAAAVTAILIKKKKKA